MRRLLTALIISGCLSLCPAAVVYDNLGAASDGADPVLSFGPLYDSFSTGASGFSLAPVWVKLVLPEDPPLPTITVDLLDDLDTTPHLFLRTIGTISESVLTPTLRDYQLVLSTPYALAPDTRYWIRLTGSGGSHAAWSWSGDLSGPGVVGEYFANSAGVWPNSSGPYQMRLSDEASIPEPASLLMMGGALLALGLLRRTSTR